MGQEPWPKPEAPGGAVGPGLGSAEQVRVLDSGLQGPCENTLNPRKRKRVGGLSQAPLWPRLCLVLKRMACESEGLGSKLDPAP